MDEVLNKINQIQKQIYSSDLPQRIRYIFQDVRHYPHWINDEDNKKIVPGIVKSAKEVKQKTSSYNEDEIVEIGVGEDKYRFIQTKRNRFNEFNQSTNPYEDLYNYPLELRVNGEKVFAMDDPLERPDDILAFVGREWVEVMNKLYDSIDEMDKNREAQNEQNRLDTLKKDFDL